MRIPRSELVKIIKEEIEGLQALDAALSVPIDRAMHDRVVQDHFFRMMQRVLELVDVNDALPPGVYDRVLDPGSGFARGIFDAIVDDLRELIESET